MPRVLIFKETILPPSETFILAQMGALTKFSPHLAGLEPAPKSLPLEEPPILLSRHASKASDLRAKIYRRIAFAPLFHRRVRDLQPDLIHAHFASSGKAVLPLQKQLRRPLIVTLHGGSDVPLHKPYVGIYRELWERATLFLCVSDFIRRQAIEAGYPADKLVVHYIGIDRTLFLPPAEAAATDSILFVGRLVEMKGCEYAIRAMRVVQARRPETEFTIIGDGPLRAAWKSWQNNFTSDADSLAHSPLQSYERCWGSRVSSVCPALRLQTGITQRAWDWYCSKRKRWAFPW